MDGNIIKLGDIFRHREKEYIFLAQTEDTIFSAKIIDSQMASRIQDLSDKRESTQSKLKKHALYSIVMLKTKDFEGKAVHLYGTDGSEHQSVVRFDVLGTLDKEDTLAIKSLVYG